MGWRYRWMDSSRGSRRVGNGVRRAAIQYGGQHDLPRNENIDEY